MQVTTAVCPETTALGTRLSYHTSLFLYQELTGPGQVYTICFVFLFSPELAFTLDFVFALVSILMAAGPQSLAHPGPLCEPVSAVTSIGSWIPASPKPCCAPTGALTCPGSCNVPQF